jgi:hypothetical protein
MHIEPDAASIRMLHLFTIISFLFPPFFDNLSRICRYSQLSTVDPWDDDASQCKRAWLLPHFVVLSRRAAAAFHRPFTARCCCVCPCLLSLLSQHMHAPCHPRRRCRRSDHGSLTRSSGGFETTGDSSLHTELAPSEYGKKRAAFMRPDSL